MLGLAVGAKTMKMHQGHHGANHPVKDETTGKVEITSMNHGFAVDQATLPKGATQTHISLFDGSNCGIALDGKPVFSVQYHPEASPGPRDSHYLFKRFADLMRAKKAGVRRHLPRTQRHARTRVLRELERCATSAAPSFELRCFVRSRLCGCSAKHAALRPGHDTD